MKAVRFSLKALAAITLFPVLLLVFMIITAAITSSVLEDDLYTHPLNDYPKELYAIANKHFIN